MIQTPTDVEMPPYTPEQIAVRLDLISGFPWGVRAALATQCQQRGHVPTGEQIVPDQPRDICFRCGQAYEAPT